MRELKKDILGQYSQMPDNRVWVSELYLSLSYALFLISIKNPTSIRLGYILIDNSIEQFIKSYLANKRMKVANRSSFPDLLKQFEEMHHELSEEISECLQFHESRNFLYHAPGYLTISSETAISYLENVTHICEKIGFIEIIKFVKEGHSRVYKNILTNALKAKIEAEHHISDTIRDHFGLTPSNYQDLYLASYPKVRVSGIMDIANMLEGMITRNASDNTITGRVFEILEAPTERRTYHTFLVSYSNTNTWHCFYNCFVSIWGKGETPEIEYIRELITNHPDVFEYREGLITARILRVAFDDDPA